MSSREESEKKPSEDRRNVFKREQERSRLGQSTEHKFKKQNCNRQRSGEAPLGGFGRLRVD